MTQIIPSILATTEDEYVQKLRKIESIEPLFENWVHIDLMDSKFVQNKSIDSDLIQKYPTNLQIEAHLMVEDPESWSKELFKITNVKRIVFPVEDKNSVTECIKLIKFFGLEAGLAINPQTSLIDLESSIHLVDTITIMSVEPGFGGQAFIVQSIDRVKEVKAMSDAVKIEVDGGISNRYIKPLVLAGADYLVVGSHLLEGDINENLGKLQEALGHK